MSDGSSGSIGDTDLKNLPGGLKYRDLKVVTEEIVQPGQRVTAHYTGWLTNGEVFDTSPKDNDQPISFPLTGVVRGW